VEQFSGKLDLRKAGIKLGVRPNSLTLCCVHDKFFRTMARRPRIEFSGAFYHVIVRGNQRQEIFHDEADCGKYLSLLSGYRERYQFKLFAYTLMSNHVHLLIETGGAPLSKILQGLSQSYTQYYNRRRKTVGHLFQGRYKAILCDRDAYLLALVRYIHLNPVRAGITEEASKYRWSSHRSYIGMEDSGLVSRDEVLKMFSVKKASARDRYMQFVSEGREDGKNGQYYRTVDQRILGGEEFAEEVERVGGKAITLPAKLPGLAIIARVISETSKVTVSDLRGPGATRIQARARRLFALVARETGHRNRTVAEYLRRDETMISKWIREKTEETTRVTTRLLIALK